MGDTTSSSASEAATSRYDVIVVGAGFAGMYQLHYLRQRGFRVLVVERGDDVGGTWYWNRYPGARCDIQSLSYSYSFDEKFQDEWQWSHRYAYQPDILKYAKAVADRFDLKKNIRFGCTITSATFDEKANVWRLKTESGETLEATFCIMATGCLSVPNVPKIAGLEDFAGDLYHSAEWPHEGVDFTGKRVGVVGTGSSGVQIIPKVASQAAELVVFQRSPNFSVPARNVPLSQQEEQEIKGNYKEYRKNAKNSISGDFWQENRMALLDVEKQQQANELEKTWAVGGFDIQYAFSDVHISPEANEIASEFIRDKIRQVVKDPRTAEKLCPKDHPIGSKRICVDDYYFETFNRDNVELVDLRETPIDRVVAAGVKTSDKVWELDALVLATGFDAMTGALLRIDIRGTGGKSLKEAWEDGPRTYLGLAVAGFPNLFTVTGPGSPSVLANVLMAIEQHVEWIGDCLTYLRSTGITRISATDIAQTEWSQLVSDEAEATLYPKANSWYIGANIPGKSRVFSAYVSGLGQYQQICNSVATDHYKGFELQSA